MTKYPLLTLLTLIAITSFAQNSLSGKVVTSLSNKPLVGATIYLTDLKTGTNTQEDGSYQLLNVPRGWYLVEVTMLGYAFQTKIIKIENQVTQDFALEESLNELQEVIITGTSVATERRKAPTSITKVPSSYLQQNASTNIIEAISKIPGVAGITDGPGITKPVIRGLAYNRVVTLNDGIRQEGQQWGDEFGIEVDANSVDQVEILKGPGSLAYGSDAIAGVINLIPEKPLPEGKFKGNILQNYQTNNGLINTSLHASGTKNGISWSGRLTNIMAHAYQNKNDGYVLNSQFNNFAYDGTIGVHRQWGYSQVHFSYFQLQTGIVSGERDSTTGKFTQAAFDGTNQFSLIATDQELHSHTPFLINQNVQHYKAVWDNSFAIGPSRIAAKLAFQQNSRQEKNDPTIPNTSTIFYLLNTVNYDVRYILPEVNHFNISAGTNGMIQDSQNKGTLLLIPEYNLFDLGVFTIASRAIGKFSLSGGIRYDMRLFNGHDNYIDAAGNELPAS